VRRKAAERVSAYTGGGSCGPVAHPQGRPRDFWRTAGQRRRCGV